MILAWRTACTRAPRWVSGSIVSTLSLGHELRAALEGIGGGGKFQLRLAVRLLDLQRIAKGQRLFALHRL